MFRRKAFTMMELVFVIVIIGILSAVAIPKFAVTRDDAVVSKAKNLVGSVRSAVATERQKRILRGDFAPITSLGLTTSQGYNKPIFDGINNDSSSPIFQYAIKSCKDSNARGCWYTADNVTYTFKMPVSGSADFNLSGGRFVCVDPTGENCKLLTQ